VSKHRKCLVKSLQVLKQQERNGWLVWELTDTGKGWRTLLLIGPLVLTMRTVK
jgi:hypothetical protein